MEKLVIVGLGHMGTALLDGFLKAGMASNEICVVSPSGSAQEKCEARRVKMVSSPDDIPFEPKIILLAVRPHHAEQVVPLYAKFKSAIFFSVMAGIELETYKGWLFDEAKIVRALPNLPTAVGQGVTLLVASNSLSKSEKTIAEELSSSVGLAVWLKSEDLYNEATALSGCGPGLMFYMMDAMAKAGEKLGLDPEISLQLSVATMFGSGAYAQEKLPAQTPADIQKSMELPGTLTGQATSVFIQKDIAKIVHKALKAATNRGRDLEGKPLI